MEKLSDYVVEIKNVGKDYDNCRKFYEDHEDNFQKLLKGVKEDWKVIEDILISCIENGREYILNFAVSIFDKRKIIKWKEHPEIFSNALDKLREVGRVPDPADETDYFRFMEKIVALMKGNQLFKENANKLFSILMAALETEENPLQSITNDYADEMPWTQNVEWVHGFMDKSFEVMQEYPELPYKKDLARTIIFTFIFIYRSSANNVKEALKYKDRVAKIFNWCKDQEWIDPDDSDERTLNHQFLKETLEDYYCRHVNKELLRPVIDSIKELWECDDEILQRDANNLMTSMPGGLVAELGGDDASEALIEKFLSGEDPMASSSFEAMYKSSPEKFDKYLDDIAENLEGGEDWSLSTIISFFREVCVSHPEKMTAKCVKHLVSTLKVEATFGMALMSLAPLSEKRPDMLLPHEDAIIANMRVNQNLASQGATILVQLAVDSEERARKYLQILKEVAKKMDSSTFAIAMVYNMRLIGEKHPQELAKHKDYFEELLNDVTLKAHAEAALDTIEGRSLAVVAQEVKETQEDVKDLDERVTNTEENVENMGKELDATKADVVVIKKDVEEQGERLGDLEEKVEEVEEKVEEIDKKTLSHAPTWSRDVSRLLNVESEHDWRLLASRLGYTNDDIRNWATQPDPCLSMFDEWFATNKTREATHAVLNHLDEMNRADAYLIVENALKQTANVVEDEEFEYVTPPPVFISYQWGHQEEVKLLKKHLEMAGFECWMDIGQMGGGDKLFEKIDAGIRAAKVVVCCVSEKYAKSPNCNREVNLSVNLGKPIIPLQMEKLQWPPPGSMGPIFGEYLYIRFFARGGGDSNDDRFWPLPKFQELLMQLAYYVPPNEEMIVEPYEGWMSPPEEVIVIKPKDKKSDDKNMTSSDGSTQEEEKSPDIFISYQWGKQPQIKALYKKLTLMGYSCWLDIMQMGGGDSLYDKIDRGIRGCKVVLTCVTLKYAKSANCRREVSLADALKKPIVPLLLEKSTWPPEGPMSMVFTQLLYINFCKPDAGIQDSWECPQMEELEGKLKLYVPSESATDNQVKIEQNSEQSPDTNTKNQNTKQESAPSSPKTKAVETNNTAKNGNQAQSHEEDTKPQSQPMPAQKKSSSCNIL